MKNRFLGIAVVALFAAVWSCSDPEVEDRCLDGTASQAECCAADPSYDFCASNNTNNTNNTNNNTANNSNNSNNSNNAGCDPACGDDEVCDSNGMCVTCVSGDDCPTETPVCEGSGADATCVQCSEADTSACDGAGQVCDTANNVCVGCLGDGDCTDGVCDTSTNECVACLDSDDCTAPEASVCDTSGAEPACVPCQMAADCAGIDGANHCIEGVCKDCTIPTEDADCGGNQCDGNNDCTQTTVGSTLSCQSCTGDSDCIAGFRCLELSFEASARGNYCQPVTPEAGCARRFELFPEMRTSVDGLAADFCVIDEALATCEAILAYEQGGCSAPTDCVTGGDGARCETANAVSFCTYSCDGANECPANATCSDYCSPN